MLKENHSSCQNILFLAQEELKRIKEKDILSEYKILMAKEEAQMLREENRKLKEDLFLSNQQNIKLMNEKIVHDTVYH